jgi:hypothetical protein
MGNNNQSELTEDSRKIMDEGFEKGNSMWDSLIKLIITLSTTLLFGSAAFFKTIFPEIENISWILHSAWAGFFITLILSIATLINEIIFTGNTTRKIAKGLDLNLNKSIKEDNHQTLKKPSQNKTYTNNSIGWGVCSIVLFLISTLFLAIGLLFPIGDLAYRLLTIGAISILIMVCHFLKIRNT